MAARSAVLDSEPLQTLDGCAFRPTAVSSGRFSHRTKSLLPLDRTSELPSRFSRALDSLGLSEVILGSRNLATSVSLE